MSGDTESLKFKIVLSGTGSPYPCNFTISIDDKVYINETTSATSTAYEFVASLTEGKHSLNIELLDKSGKHITKDSDGNLDQDFQLNIESIAIDDIDLAMLIWTLSKYYPKYPDNYEDLEQKAKTVVTDCVTLGWNGVWSLEFDSPFYLWLLENI